MKKMFESLVLYLLLVCLTACNKTPQHQEIRILKVPEFNAENAFDHIRTQVEFGPRVVGMSGHSATRSWIVETLDSYGFDVAEQSFQTNLYDGRKVSGTNIIARHNPHVIDRLLLGAHWDTRPFADKDTVRMEEPIPGADDGASGVGVVIEIGRLIKENDIPMGVDLVFFDLEDYGDPEADNVNSWGLGAQHWARAAKKDGYKAKYGIFLDMVGARDAQFTIEGLSAASASKQVVNIWTLAKAMGQEKYFIPRRTEAIVDDHRFVFEITAMPVVNIVNHGKEDTFASYHHTHGDNMNIISKNTLRAVGQVVTAVVFKESNMEF